MNDNDSDYSFKRFLQPEKVTPLELSKQAIHYVFIQEAKTAIWSIFPCIMPELNQGHRVVALATMLNEGQARLSLSSDLPKNHLLCKIQEYKE